MTTIINTPPTNSDNSGGSYGGLIVGIVISAILVFIFVVYGLPAMRGNNKDSGITTVTVPDKIDVNVNKGN